MALSIALAVRMTCIETAVLGWLRGAVRSVEGQVKTSSFYILLGGPILIFGFLEIRSYTRKTLRYDNLDFLIIDSL